MPLTEPQVLACRLLVHRYLTLARTVFIPGREGQINANRELNGRLPLRFVHQRLVKLVLQLVAAWGRLVRGHLAIMLHDVHVEFQSDRLLLRRWDPDDDADVAAAFDIYRRDEVARWLGSKPQPWASLEVARLRLERWRNKAEERPGYGRWAITLGGFSTPMGSILLSHLPANAGYDELTNDVEIGWHLHPDHWGNGYATEAAQRVLEHAWQLEISEVNAVAYAGNDPSTAVMRRLGMERQGMTSRWYGVEMEWWLIGAPLPSAA
ncbi:MAG: GNAT family N-acetyltransferase [Candidatus Nanopelagicales bacterium]